MFDVVLPADRGAAICELGSVIAALRAEVVSEMPDARVERDFGELQAACEAIEAERLRRLAEIDRRRLFERDGHLSAVSWLAARFRVAWGEARRAMAMARAIEGMPAMRASFEQGAISLSAVRVLARRARQSLRPYGPPRGFSSMPPHGTASPTCAEPSCTGVTWWRAIERETIASSPCSGRDGACTLR